MPTAAAATLPVRQERHTRENEESGQRIGVTRHPGSNGSIVGPLNFTIGPGDVLAHRPTL